MAGIRRGGIGVTEHDGGPGDVGMEGNTDAKVKWSSWKTTIDKDFACSRIKTQGTFMIRTNS